MDSEIIINMRIREMRAEDIEEIVRIGTKEKYFQVSSSLDGFWSRKQLHNWIKSNDDVLLVAEDGDRMVGFAISSLHKPTGKATFENLWVDPSSRNRNIATKLSLHLIKGLKANGATYICGMTKTNNKNMLRLFDKLGFDKGYEYNWMGKLI
ncbi:MAG: GNAT family N-acetyltransferase [Victivallales bacterium]|nr:GNAT family N-acetyltransferase [Victivallales bacterium]